MGDTSPKNIQKLTEKKHEEHEKKVDEKHQNAEIQHHHKEPVLEETTAAAE